MGGGICAGTLRLSYGGPIQTLAALYLPETNRRTFGAKKGEKWPTFVQIQLVRFKPCRLRCGAPGPGQSHRRRTRFGIPSVQHLAQHYQFIGQRGQRLTKPVNGKVSLAPLSGHSGSRLADKINNRRSQEHVRVMLAELRLLEQMYACAFLVNPMERLLKFRRFRDWQLHAEYITISYVQL
jgi:hypothetical protein